jgi:hypothetical protein
MNHPRDNEMPRLVIEPGKELAIWDGWDKRYPPKRYKIVSCGDGWMEVYPVGSKRLKSLLNDTVEFRNWGVAGRVMRMKIRGVETKKLILSVA